MTSFESTVNSLRQRFQQDNQPLPPVTLGAINSDDTFKYAKHFGEKVDGSTAGIDDMYWLASATKLITTVAVMQCVERGQLNLDDDIAKVLPEFKNPQILTGFDEKDEAIFKPATKAINLRHLLTYSSGIAYVFMDPLLTRYQELKGVQEPYPKSVAEKFPHQFLVFEPGEKWMYSPGIDWAGVMIERITSMTLNEYMQRNLFDVISVKDVSFHPERRADLRARKAKSWVRGSQGLEEQASAWPDIPLADFGGGGIFASVKDLLLVYQGILSGKLLRPETVKEMFRPHLESVIGLDTPNEYSSGYRNSIWNSIPSEVPVNFGIGGVLNIAAVPGRRAANSLTWSGYPNCYWWIDLENGVAGVYLSQLTPSGDDNSVVLLTEFEKFVYSTLNKSS